MNRPKFLKTVAFILMIGAIFLWLPIFAHYHGLMEADFLTSNLSFENADLDFNLAGGKSLIFFVASLGVSLSWQALLYIHLHFFLSPFFTQNSCRLRF